jgi:hypothetical protein
MIRVINAQTGTETTREYNAKELAAINDPAMVKENTNASIQAQIATLEAQVTPRLMRDFILRPNVPMGRPSGPPKTPSQIIAEIDAQIEALKATLQP